MKEYEIVSLEQQEVAGPTDARFQKRLDAWFCLKGAAAWPPWDIRVTDPELIKELNAALADKK